MPWQPWMKFAILGSTYARALQNASARAGRTFAPNAFDHIAAQPQAVLKPGLSSFVREPGVLPQTPQTSAMQGLAHRLPWAGEEHTTDAMSAKAPARFDRVLEQHGLVHNTPAGQPTAQQRIDSAFGRFSDRREWQAANRTQVPQQGVSKAEDRTAVLPKGSAGIQQNVPTPLAGHAPSLSDGGSFVRPTVPAASPNRFPRARLQAGKVAAALPTAVGVGIPLAVGAGMLASKPGIKSNIHNLMSGKGSTQEQDVSGAIPDQALQQAQAIHQHLTGQGLDPNTMRIGIDAPPGSGKTTLARALAQQTGMRHYGLDWEPGNAWKSTVGLGRNVEKMPHAPRAGEIMEHYLLNRTHDPELFDAQIHLRRDPAVIRQQLNQRGNAAYIGDLMDLDKSLGVADLGFDTLDGDEVDLGNGAVMKLRPRQGWGNQLDRRLLAVGMDPTGLSRHEKLLTLHSGQRTTGAGWTPYIKNPFTTGQTLALGASIPLGVMAARALANRPKLASNQIKLAIGKRQTERMRDAVMSMREQGTIPAADHGPWRAATDVLTPHLDEQLGQWKNILPSAKNNAQSSFDSIFQPDYPDPRKEYQRYRSNGWDTAPLVGPATKPREQIENVLTSGRHSTRDIVDVPFIEHSNIAETQHGVHPDRLAWRGASPSAGKGTGPRWFSGLPSVSAGYAKQPGDRLNAFALSDIPDAEQGPWTPHIAKDPRGMDVSNLHGRSAGNSTVGDSHIYEKVIDAAHIPDEPFISYKTLPTPGRFQRVKGPNALLGDSISGSVPIHVPSVTSLEHRAPELFKRFSAGQIPRTPRSIASLPGRALSYDNLKRVILKK